MNLEMICDADYSDNIFDENSSISRIPTVLWTFRIHNLKVKNLKNIMKYIRKKFNLNKSPKNKGYVPFFTEEEKRYCTHRI